MKILIDIADEPDEDGDYIAAIEGLSLSAFGPTQALALHELATVISASAPDIVEAFLFQTREKIA